MHPGRWGTEDGPCDAKLCSKPARTSRVVVPIASTVAAPILAGRRIVPIAAAAEADKNARRADLRRLNDLCHRAHLRLVAAINERTLAPCRAREVTPITQWRFLAIL